MNNSYESVNPCNTHFLGAVFFAYPKWLTKQVADIKIDKKLHRFRKTYVGETQRLVLVKAKGYIRHNRMRIQKDGGGRTLKK